MVGRCRLTLGRPRLLLSLEAIFVMRCFQMLVQFQLAPLHRGVADDKEHSVPVFGNSLVGRGAQTKSSAERRERLFAAELWLAARHSDFVLGGAVQVDPRLTLG